MMRIVIVGGGYAGFYAEVDIVSGAATQIDRSGSGRWLRRTCGYPVRLRESRRALQPGCREEEPVAVEAVDPGVFDGSVRALQHVAPSDLHRPPAFRAGGQVDRGHAG
jgi:hypothetical protein